LPPLADSNRHLDREFPCNARGGTATEAFVVSNRDDRFSRDAVERAIRKKRMGSGKAMASLKKKRVTPHVLRHGARMQLLKTRCRHP
jgi:integrase/recombinase XerD